MNFLQVTFIEFYENRRSSVTMVTMLLCGRPENRGSILGRDERFSLLHCVWTGSGAHLAYYKMGTEVTRPEREPDHSPPTSAEVKNAWSYTATPPYVFMALCLVKYKDNFFYLYFICRSWGFCDAEDLCCFVGYEFYPEDGGSMFL
jgi:hypothetical protein